MSNHKPDRAAVRRTLLAGKKLPDRLSTLDNVCSSGAQCAKVQSSPVALAALNDLHQEVTTARAMLIDKQLLAQALLAAIGALKLQSLAVKVALDTYQAAVAGVAKGDASVINDAGLLARDLKAPSEDLGKVTSLKSKQGKHALEAIVSWPPGPGASGYAIEVNYAPQIAGSPWTALPSGSGRSRVVKGPAQGAQLLVRVASVGSDGTQSEWSDPILVTVL